MAKHSIRRGIVNLSYHEKISEITVTVAEKTLAVSNLGLNGTLQKRRDTNVENRIELQLSFAFGLPYHRMPLTII